MNADQLRAEVERLGPWMHDMEIGEGIRTGSARDTSNPDLKVQESYPPALMMGELVRTIYGGSLAGRSFLDCACNAGGYSFEAARMGAERIFAFDARQHWLDQASFLKQVTGDTKVELRRLTLDAFAALDVEPFDVTLFKGIFYHLPDPVAGLRIAADKTRELLVVNTSAKPADQPGLLLSRESTTNVLSGVDGLAWLPTGPDVMQEILGWCGFPHVRIDSYWQRQSGPRWWRLQILAARDESTFARYDQLRPDAHPLRRQEAPPSILKRLSAKVRGVLAR